MRKSHLITAFALLLDLALISARPGLAASAEAFDGAWNVEVNCPDVGDVRGYDWRFLAEVRSGVLTRRAVEYVAPIAGAGVCLLMRLCGQHDGDRF